MKKKLLFVITTLVNGGGERSLINLLQLIDYEKYDVDLLLLKEKGAFLCQVPKEVNFVSNADDVHFMYSNLAKNILNFRKIKLNLIHIFGTIVSKIKSHSDAEKVQYRWEHYYKQVIPRLEKYYDTAISYLEGEPMLYVVDKVNASRKLAWIHTDYSKLNANKSVDSKYFEQLDQVISISDTCVDVLKNNFPNLSEKFVCLPNLISSKTISFLANQFYPKEFLNVDEIKIISVGRLVQIKGFDMAIEATKILKEKNIKFKWYIIGNGELKNTLERMRKNYNLENEIIFLGMRENPYPYLKNADIVVQPSRYEGKSMVLDEAKILGKPIVVTKYDTVFDQIKGGEGKIVDMNPKSIALGIEEMVQEKEKYSSYLMKNEYGNQREIVKYYEYIDGINSINS